MQAGSWKKHKSQLKIRGKLWHYLTSEGSRNQKTDILSSSTRKTNSKTYGIQKCDIAAYNKRHCIVGSIYCSYMHSNVTPMIKIKQLKSPWTCFSLLLSKFCWISSNHPWIKNVSEQEKWCVGPQQTPSIHAWKIKKFNYSKSFT